MTKEETIKVLAHIIFDAAKMGYMPFDTNDELCAMNIARKRIEELQPSLPSNLDEAAINRMHAPDMYLSDATIEEIGDALLKMAYFGAEWMAGQGWKEVDNQNYPTPDKKKIYVVYTKEHYHLARVINHPNDEDLYQWMCTEFPNYRYDMCEGDKYIEIRKITPKTETE